MLIKRILPAFPAGGAVMPAAGDVLLAVNGVRAADAALAADVLKASVGLVDLRIIHYGALPSAATPQPLTKGTSVTLSKRGSLQVSGDI